jgi:hypothetical protein
MLGSKYTRSGFIETTEKKEQLPSHRLEPVVHKVAKIPKPKAKPVRKQSSPRTSRYQPY